MSNYIHCPQNRVTPLSNSQQIPESKLCDFCWYEYCFCWSQYCLNEWYEMQTQHNPQQFQEKPGDRQSQD
ncbi:hypothetical protein [Anabaena sp. PCC 7108]|uniref:hypothetical protein n=1 Tax=Anabaena sp. PCC 7108 TaxID=163908 RepID=UPI000348B9CC|nr:hypothetical protein [Anabaena sp. PCC 7108]